MEDGKLALLSEFGFSHDPFAQTKVETVDAQRIRRLVTMAIDSRAMVAIVGARGYGKSEAITSALTERENVVEVRLLSGEKEAVKIGDIERAIVLDLGAALGTNEGVKRSKEVRARQVRRMLGDAAKMRRLNVVLILEEAHRMHGATLRSLKTMREMAWMGMCPLMTVVLIGQYDPFRNNPSVDEVRLRSDKIELKGLTSGEVKHYISETVGRCFEDDAVEAVSKISGPAGRGQNFLELQDLLCRLMATAMRHGHKKVRAIDVFALTGGGLAEVIKKAGMTQAEIAKETGINKTEISMISNGNQGTISDSRAEQTRTAILRVVAKKLGEKQVAAEEAQEKIA